MKATKAQIDQFLESKTIAIVGASRDKNKFGNHVLQALAKSQYEVLPINPNCTEINGIKCYTNLEQIEQKVESLLLLTPKNTTDEILEKAISKGVTNIWIQKESLSSNTIELANKSQTNIIVNQCILMFAEPVTSIHKFHRFCSKFIGSYPK